MWDLELFEKAFSIASDLFTIVGLIVGGAWTYLLFVKNRQIYPKLDIEHKAVFKKDNDKNYIILTLCIIIKNTSHVLVKINDYTVDVWRLIPAPKRDKKINQEYLEEFGFYRVTKDNEIFSDGKPLVNSIELEPSETHQITYLIIMPLSIEVIVIESKFINPMKTKRPFWKKFRRKFNSPMIWHNMTTLDFSQQNKTN